MAAEVAGSPVEAAVDTPIPATGTTSEDSLSLSDHEARYGEGRQDAAAEAATRPVETPDAAAGEAADGDDAGPRDDKGRFLPKPKRHRAESAIAGPEDVPRIQQLTARLRAAEAERDALKNAGTDGRQSVPANVQPIASPLPVAVTAKPTPDQFQDYGDFIEALTDWKTDQKLTAAETKRTQAAQQAQAEFESRRIETSFNQRKAAAREKYPDFDAVAIHAPTRIPIGSLIDAWVMEHATGADVLYHLQSHPDELTDLLEQPVLEQAESLALLAQRFNGHSRTPVAATGSTATLSIPPPKPPNPVRTGPLRSGDDPPDEEVASLADHEKWYPSRRRRAG